MIVSYMKHMLNISLSLPLPSIASVHLYIPIGFLSLFDFAPALLPLSLPLPVIVSVHVFVVVSVYLPVGFPAILCCPLCFSLYLSVFLYIPVSHYSIPYKRRIDEDQVDVDKAKTTVTITTTLIMMTPIPSMTTSG